MSIFQLIPFRGRVRGQFLGKILKLRRRVGRPFRVESRGPESSNSRGSGHPGLNG